MPRGGCLGRSQQSKREGVKGKTREKKERDISNHSVAVWTHLEHYSQRCLKPKDKLEMFNARSGMVIWG